MTNPRDDRLFSSLPKNRKSPPGADAQNSGFFQTGQGGRTVLPPLASAFPTSPSSVPVNNNYPSYPLQRSSPTKIDHSSPSYPHWSSIPIPQQHPSYYDHYDRYPQAQPYPNYPSRSSPVISPDPHNSRKLPPLNTSDRYQTGYGAVAPQLPNYPDVRSPTANYPEYYPQTSYSFPPVPDQRHHSSHHSTSMHHHPPVMYPIPERGMPAQVEAHGTSPYARGSITHTRITDEPQQMMVHEEPTAIKKKRKRADAAQLKVLNETYERTAFPSTEERAELAKKLDMSARSVQIWFQNKRQSMRQTTRQTITSVPPPQQQFSIPSSAEDHSSFTGNISPTAVPQSAYNSRQSQDSRSVTQESRSSMASQRRDDDHRRWPQVRY